MPSPDATISEYWALFAFLLGIITILCFMLGLSYLLGGRAIGRGKNEQFESGIVPTGSTKLRLSAKFYFVAILFVIFDIEALYLIAYSVAVREIGWIGFIGASIFIFILIVGLIYEWRIGALDWAPASRKKETNQLN